MWYSLPTEKEKTLDIVFDGKYQEEFCKCDKI